MLRRGLVLDLDNTLYNWVDFFAPSFRAMVHVLARVTQLEEDIIIESFRRVYKKHKSVEYAFAIQELDVWESLDWSDERIEREAVKPARGAFRKTRRKHLHLYPHVRETLIWATREAALVIIGLSDAPLFQSEMRLKSFQLDHLFSGLYSWKGYDKLQPLPKIVTEEFKEGKYRSRIDTIGDISASDLKPNPGVLRAIIDQHKLEVRKTYLVGDSLEKDIAAAQEVGITDIWARYGKTVLPKSISTLTRITHWDNEEIDRSRKAHLIISPTHIIDDFSEIKSIVGLQLSFDF